MADNEKTNATTQAAPSVKPRVDEVSPYNPAIDGRNDCIVKDELSRRFRHKEKPRSRRHPRQKHRCRSRYRSRDRQQKRGSRKSDSTTSSVTSTTSAQSALFTDTATTGATTDATTTAMTTIRSDMKNNDRRCVTADPNRSGANVTVTIVNEKDPDDKNDCNIS
ncbi:uncharacterized protein LOC111271931 [Varroa jacobsoni]|nr:uncharacterized protein LOC111271931 [Varroa jacobsoni]